MRLQLEPSFFVARTMLTTAVVVTMWACGTAGDVTNDTANSGSRAAGPGGAASVGGAASAAGGGSASGGQGGSTQSSGGGGVAGNTGSDGAASGGAGSGGVAAGGAGNGGNGGNGSQGDPCQFSAPNCNSGLFCDAPGCAAGTCEPVVNVAAQLQTYDPLCGCDGVNYFNPSVARSYGMAAAHAGQCTALEEMTCDKVNAPCPNGLSCSIEVQTLGVCAPNLSAGVCWGAPITCGTGQPRARGCVPPNDCANLCALIRSQNGWFADATCP